MADTEYDVTVSVNETVNADVGSTQEQGSQQIGDEVLNLSAESSEDVLIDANITMTEALDVTAEENTGGTDDHRKLYYRNAENQHNIASITGLQAELDDITGDISGHTTAISIADGKATEAKSGLDNLTPIVSVLETDVGDVKDNASEVAAALEAEVSNRMLSSLIDRGVASVDEEHGIITLYNASNMLKIDGSSIIFSRNNKPTAYITSDYGASLLKSDNARFTYIYMRDPNGVGSMSWIATSTGHVTLKRY